MTSSRTRRLPAAVVAGMAMLLAGPLLGSGTPRQEILGVAATAEATAAPIAAALAVSSAAGVTDIGSEPDPAGDRSAPRARLPQPPETLTGYRWPIRNASLTLPFGPSSWGSRIVNGEPFHDGIDLATHCGDRLTAAHDGTVLAAGRHYDAEMGWVGDLTPYTDRLNEKHLWLTLPNVVVIDDGNGYRSVYAHFRRVVVAPGDVVLAGDLLGYEGMTGRATGCHLHYGLFSPYEVATFGIEPVAVEHMLLPAEEIARIDPLLVLPPLDEAGIH
jgi:murein DD-endopeptidase MepM/ murein hydrolase activator NlpD